MGALIQLISCMNKSVENSAMWFHLENGVAELRPFKCIGVVQQTSLHKLHSHPISMALDMGWLCLHIVHCYLTSEAKYVVW